MAERQIIEGGMAAVYTDGEWKDGIVERVFEGNPGTVLVKLLTGGTVRVSPEHVSPSEY